eukprot:1597691-Amphidinium_carterae.2
MPQLPTDRHPRGSRFSQLHTNGKCINPMRSSFSSWMCARHVTLMAWLGCSRWAPLPLIFVSMVTALVVRHIDLTTLARTCSGEVVFGDPIGWLARKALVSSCRQVGGETAASDAWHVELGVYRTPKEWHQDAS